MPLIHWSQESATEQFLKDLMVQREQKVMEKGGEKVGVGKFQQAGLDENKSLHMKTPTTTGLPFHLPTIASDPYLCFVENILFVHSGKNR